MSSPCAEPGPRLVVQEDRRDLREREHEDEVEEQLERRDPVLALEGLLAHMVRLTRWPTAIPSCCPLREGLRV